MKYELLDNGIAHISLDNGKVNAVSFELAEEFLSLLDKAETEAKAIVICGNEGIFSAGFDLKVVTQGLDIAKEMFVKGFELLERLYSYPLPVVIACQGHAVGLGVFLLLAADYRVGALGDFHLQLPETKISLNFAPILRIIARTHIDPKHHSQAIIQSRAYDPKTAAQIGIFDEAVEPNDVLQKAFDKAIELGNLPTKQYAINKRFIRADEIKAISENRGV